MAVSLVSTVPAVQAAFVTAARLEVPTGVTVHRTWPGPDATGDMVFFTDVEWSTTEDATIKAGRRFRNESYDANFEIWAMASPSATPESGGDAVDRAFAIYDAVEEAVVKSGSTVQTVAGVVQVVCGPVRYDIGQINKGWGVAMQARLSVTARLT